MNLRNIAIIAHVDHGKTTLVDRLLQQSGVVPRQPARGRTRHGFQRPGARARYHDPGQGRLGRMEGHPHQHRRHAGPRRFRRRGRAHPQHGGRRAGAGRRRRGPAAADQIRGVEGAARWGSSPSSSSTRSTARTRGRSKSSTKCSTCSPRSTPPTSSSISRSSTARPNRAGWRRRWKARTTTACSRCSIWSSATSSRRWWSKGRSACSAPFWKPIPISAASSPAASPPARSSRTSRSRCSTTTAS